MSTFVNNNVSSGAIVYASDHNEQGARIAAVVNGGLDDNNISSLSGTKIISATIPSAALDSNLAGGWNASPDVFTYSSNNGNKEFTVTTPSDVTGRYSPGMKMRFTRGTTAPTQSMAFTAASSQYASKSSPSGITFTSAFTCEAWIYLNSYPSPTPGMVVDRLDATAANGWYMTISQAGQLVMNYASSSATTTFLSYQSLPLKRWIHVAIAVTSVSSKTGAIYINGVSVPFSTTGTATALTQAGTLAIGGWGTNPSQYLDAYLSEVRVWSNAQSQANIQANMAVSLTGSESNLVALFQGNGNLNDKNTVNANNLTANNGAIATQLANPYNNTEYGIVTKVAYSSPNTTITLFTGTDCAVPNMTLSNAQYSTARSPFGFPVAKGKWIADTLILADTNNGASTSGNYYNVGNGQLNIPTGEWIASFQASIYTIVTSGPSAVRAFFSTANNSASDIAFGADVDSTGTNAAGWVSKTKPLSLSSITPFYLVLAPIGASPTSLFLLGGRGGAVLTAECAYI